MNSLSAHYFLSVVKYKGITKAAQHLSVSQQNISRHIARLEEEFNATFFERKPNFCLTYAGEEFARGAENILRMEESLHKRLTDIATKNTGCVTIGVTPVRSPTVLPRLLPQYNQQYPGVDLRLKMDVTGNLIEMLKSGEIDLFISYISSHLGSNIQTFPLLEERLCLVVPKTYMENKYGKSLPEILRLFRTSLILSEFSDTKFLMHVKGSWTREMVDRYVQEQNFTPDVLLEYSDMPTLISLAVQGMGVTFAFEHLARQALGNTKAASERAYIFPVTDTNIAGTVVIGFDKKQYLSHAAQNFIHLAMEAYRTP